MAATVLCKEAINLLFSNMASMMPARVAYEAAEMARAMAAGRSRVTKQFSGNR